MVIFMIRARVVIEMLGKPQEYIADALRKYVATLKETYTIQTESYAKPKEQGQHMFSVFAELEVDFKKLEELSGFCIDAMPSSIDILEPAELQLSAPTVSEFFNDVQSKLHQTDMLVKTLTAKQNRLDDTATRVFHNFILFILHHQRQTISQLSKKVGVSEQQLEPFLDHLIKENKVVRKEHVYESTG